MIVFYVLCLLSQKKSLVINISSISSKVKWLQEITELHGSPLFSLHNM